MQKWRQEIIEKCSQKYSGLGLAMTLREFLFNLLGKTQEQRWDEASPLGKKIYIAVTAVIFFLIVSVWIYGGWWR
jgi:hypothetical protein